MTKSYATIATKLCPICGKEWNTDRLLLDCRLRKTFEKNTCTGIGLCPEHKAMVESGDYVALIEVEPEIDQQKGTAVYVPSGNGMLMDRQGAIEVFQMEMQPYSYVEIGVLDLLKERFDARHAADQKPTTLQ